MIGYEFAEPKLQLSGKKGYSYIVAGNGLFVEAHNNFLYALIQVEAFKVRGLNSLLSLIDFKLPKVPRGLVERIFNKSRSVCVEKGEPVEALFYLSFDGEEWLLDIPHYQATKTSVTPLDNEAGSRVQIELHSHNEMDAFFSGEDDADEQGFKIYAVIGRIFSKPKILVRIGVNGYFCEIPANQIFELPEDVRDNYGKERVTL